MTTCHFNGVMDVPEYIVYARKKYGMSRRLFRMLLPGALTDSTLRGYEDGSSIPLISRLFDIQAATGVSVDMIDTRIKRAVKYIEDGTFAKRVMEYPHSRSYIGRLCGTSKYTVSKLCNIPVDCVPITAEQACMIADFVEGAPIADELVKLAEQQDEIDRACRRKSKKPKRVDAVKPEPPRRKIETDADRERFARQVMRSLLGEYKDPYRFDRKFGFRCIAPGKYEAQTDHWIYITIDIIDQKARLRVWWRRDGHLVMERMIAA